jgi:hypothetical protein
VVLVSGVVCGLVGGGRGARRAVPPEGGTVGAARVVPERVTVGEGTGHDRHVATDPSFPTGSAGLPERARCRRDGAALPQERGGSGVHESNLGRVWLFGAVLAPNNGGTTAMPDTPGPTFFPFAHLGLVADCDARVGSPRNIRAGESLKNRYSCKKRAQTEQPKNLIFSNCPILNTSGADLSSQRQRTGWCFCGSAESKGDRVPPPARSTSRRPAGCVSCPCALSRNGPGKSF